MFSTDYWQRTLFLIPLFPLLGFLLNGLLGFRLGGKTAGHIAVLAACASFVWSLLCTLALEQSAPDSRNTLHAVYGSWICTPGFNCSWGLLLDQVSAVMILVVTGVGAVIHLYSVGYMAHDQGAPRFFAYMNLFLFAMLLLVLSDNLVLLFVGWEGVGLCSYLLIGYWYEDAKNAAAGMKAFIVNRIGDLGFLLGIFTLIAIFGTVNYVSSPKQPGLLDCANSLHAQPSQATLLTLACVLLFIGAIGKSAQIPLYVWLPDAMAGPTPVSALIHAATMVTAGVYMVCRLHGLFSASPDALLMVAIVGGCTALLGGLIALTQLDIKRVLAYSTVSQLGYMFLALGVGAFSIGLFHLLTHAFFKALLFLGAGSVIHALAGEQDLRRMGGLRKRMPVTFWTMLIGGASLAGVPLLAGWYSKDDILMSVLVQYRDSHNGILLMLYVFGLVAALCTAFYTFRLISLAFGGENRGVQSDTAKMAALPEHIHESPRVMTMPLIALALFAAVAGLLWHGKFTNAAANMGIHNLVACDDETHKFEHWLNLGLTFAVLCVGAALALYLYLKRRHVPDPNASKSILYRFVLNKFYVDETYNALIIMPFYAGAEILHWGVEVLGIDLLITGSGYLVTYLANLLRRMQTGLVNSYALGILLGAVAVLLYLLKWS